MPGRDWGSHLAGQPVWVYGGVGQTVSRGVPHGGSGGVDSIAGVQECQAVWGTRDSGVCQSCQACAGVH